MQEDHKKYALTKAMMNPLWVFSDNLGVFAAVGGLFAALLVLLSYLFGQTYVCAFHLEAAAVLPCGEGNSYLYFPYLLCKIAIIAAFVTVWYDKVFLKLEIDKAYLQGFGRKYLRNAAALFVFLLLNLIPIVSVVLLLFRVPNPVWQIELAYFTIVASGFVVPLVLMRFYAVFAQFLAGEGFKNIKQIWQAGSGNNVKIIMSVSVLFMINIVLLAGIYSSLRQNNMLPPVVYNLTAEFIYDVLTLLMIALVTNFMQTQKDIFESDMAVK